MIMKKLTLLIFMFCALNAMAQYKPGQINAKFENQRYAFINSFAEQSWVLRKSQNVLNPDDLYSFRRIYGINATMNGKDISPLTLSIIPDCADMRIRFMFDSDSFTDGFELDLSKQMVMYAYDFGEAEFSVVTKYLNGDIMWLSFANPQTGDNTVTMVRRENGKPASILPLALKLDQEQYDTIFEYLKFLNEHGFICGEPYAP